MNYRTTFLLAFTAQPAAAALLSVSENGMSHHNMVVVQPTPKCWNAAIESFPEISPSIDTVKFCALLPEQDQKRLALEIARCHMLDLGKPLVHRPCHQLDDCLRDLTLEGANAYTHYITYVQQLCIRLTQELLVQQQHQTQVEMGQEYKKLSQETLAQVKNLQRSVVQHVQNLNDLSDFPQRLRDDLSRELQEKLAQTLALSLDRELEKHLATQLENQLGHQLSNLLQQQAIHQADFVEGILDDLNVRDQELQERFKMWEHYQTSLWSNHAMEVEKQRRQIEEQRSRMEYLSDTLSQASRSLQPLVGLKAVLKMVSGSYTWLTSCMHFLFHVLVVWVITRPRRCQSFRVSLFQITIAEAVIELFINWMLHNEILESKSTVEVIRYLRLGVRVVLLLMYLTGFLSSFKRAKKASQQQFYLDYNDWERTNDPFVSYYQSPPPIPQRIPLVTPAYTPKPKHRRLSRSPEPLLQRRIQPRQQHSVPSHSPSASSTVKTIFRAVPPPPPPQEELARSEFHEDITIAPSSSVDNEEGKDEFHDVLESPPEVIQGRKRKQVLLADLLAASEETQPKKSKNVSHHSY